MRKLNFYIILTADGMYSDPEGGLGHYEPAEDEHRFANDLVRDAGDIVIGRVMYSDFMDYWDQVDIDDPAVTEVEREFARYWRETPKHVVSRGRPALRANADLLEGDVVETVRRMKAGDGPDIMLGGGADLLATVAAAGLIDTYRLLLTPMALGKGKAMFASLEAPLSLRLVGTRTFSSGSVLLEYEPA
ncbi:MAG: dihydrofolate reductase family protein [Chloroflexota bacterium]